MSVTLTNREFSSLWNHIAILNARLLELRTYDAGDALSLTELEISEVMAILKAHRPNKNE